jgi:type IV secretion system protein TrbL
MRHVLATVLLAVTAWASPALAETITVSPDAGGTIKPLQQAVARAGAGDTIIVNDGEYRGNLSLSGKYGTANAPIMIQSKNPQGARIVGPSNGSTISAWGVGHVTIQGFEVVGTYKGNADNNVFHIGGPFTNPATGVAIVGNRVTGTANDGIKFMEGAAGNMILGNLIDGTWKEEAMDNVSVQDMVIANNTIRGTAGNTGLTYKAGSHNFEIVNNDFGINAPVQISNGGYGDSREDRWDRMSPQFKGGDEARDSVVKGNTIDGNVRLISATNITIEDNDISGTVSNGVNSYWSGAIASNGNTVRNNGTAQDDTGAGDLNTPIPVAPVNPGVVAGDPTITNPVPDGTETAPDPATVPVPPGQPAIPAAPPAFTPSTPPSVYPPPSSYVPPTPPAPPPAASVLTNLSNHPILSAAPALNVNLLDGLVETFTNQAKLWESSLTAIATSLFVKLAIIEIIWVVGWATARRESFETIIEVLAMQMITIGFFYWLMINTADFILAIVESFGIAANQASIAGGGMTNLGPTDIFAAGMNMSKKIWDGMTIMDLDFSFLLVLAGIINIIVFAKITAKLIEVLIESSFCAYAGIILMGFGGSRFTRDYAVSVFRYGISVGVKRLFLQLIVGLGQGIVVGWATQVEKIGAGDWVTLAIMLGVPLIMLGLADTLPQKAQDLIMGVYTGGSGATVGQGAGLAAAGAAGAAAGLAGGALAGKAAFQLAQQQIADRQSQAQITRQPSGVAQGAMGRAAQLTGMAARNLGSAMAGDVGKRMNGTGGRFGHRSFRMANDMQNKRRG